MPFKLLMFHPFDFDCFDFASFFHREDISATCYVVFDAISKVSVGKIFSH